MSSDRNRVGWRAVQTDVGAIMCVCVCVYRVYQNDWSGLEVDYFHKYGEQTYKR